MAYSDTQKVDYLFKKLGYSVAKTDTFANKGPANEGNASPLLSPGDTIWVSSGQIASTAQLPTGNSSVVSVYRDTLSSTVQCVNAGAATTNATWFTNLTNWIPASYGSGYQVKLYAGPSGSATPQNYINLPAAGVNSDSWFFDYQAGIVQFGDTNIPAAVSGNVVYVVGARYTGPVGLNNAAPTLGGTINTANVSLYSNSSITSTNSTYYLQLQDVASGNAATYTASTLSFNPSSGNLTTSNVSATQFNGSLIGAVLTPSQTLITTVGNLTNLTVGGNITTIGNVTTTNGVFWPNGQAYGSGTTYANANVTALLTGLTSLVSTSGNLSAGNLITTQANLTTIVATGNIYASSLVGVQFGNVNTNYIIGGAANINIIPGTGNILNISSTTAMLVPSGTTVQRPTGVPGYIRYNQTTSIVEYYNGSAWIPVTTTVSDQSFGGDGSTTIFNLTNVTNAAGILVSINGVVQNPNTYTVNGPGTQITFVEAPLVTDVVDIRYLSVAVTNNGTFSTDVSVTGNITLTGLLSSPLTTKTSTSAGVAGQIAYDANYVYVCTATNTWKRVALTGGVF